MNATSLSFPNMFDVSRNKVNVFVDSRAVTSRVKLLLLTEPTELYMVPNFGVGLKKYMFTYNNDNTIALIKDKLIEQLRIWEPCVIPEDTIVERGLAYTEAAMQGDEAINNILKLTITLTTIDGNKASVEISDKDLNVAV